MIRKLYPAYTCGLDLGQQRDFTAFAVLESSTLLYPERNPVTFEQITKTQVALRALKRFPLRTSYTDIVDLLRDLLRKPPLAASATLVLDATGCGLPVYDLIKSIRSFPARVIPVTITGGERPSRDGLFHRIPRRHLLSNLYTLFSKKDLTIARRLPLSQTLLQSSPPSATPSTHPLHTTTLLLLRPSLPGSPPNLKSAHNPIHYRDSIPTMQHQDELNPPDKGRRTFKNCRVKDFTLNAQCSPAPVTSSNPLQPGSVATVTALLAVSEYVAAQAAGSSRIEQFSEGRLRPPERSRMKERRYHVAYE